MTHPALTETLEQIRAAELRMGELKKIAATIKRDQDLADQLWATGEMAPRMVAVLIMTKEALSEPYIEQLAEDLMPMPASERTRISEWLLANQLMKYKPTQVMLTTWMDHANPLLRRLYWYQEARKRWTGKVQDNSAQLMPEITANLAIEHPDVQWTMNFCAAWIGIFEPEHRQACIDLGEDVGLYREEKVPKNCTPNFLPEFIRIEVAKRA